MHSVQYIGRLTKILISTLEGILKRKFLDYESVDAKELILRYVSLCQLFSKILIVDFIFQFSFNWILFEQTWFK